MILIKEHRAAVSWSSALLCSALLRSNVWPVNETSGKIKRCASAVLYHESFNESEFDFVCREEIELDKNSFWGVPQILFDAQDFIFKNL